MKKVIIESSNIFLRQETIDSNKIEFTDVSDSMIVSDGYHTMSELYNHRHALFCALVKIYDGYRTPLESSVTCWKSKLHADGSMFEDSFIVQMIASNGMYANSTFQISYHLPMSWWNKFNIMEIEKAWPHDGHSSDDVIERLLKL